MKFASEVDGMDIEKKMRLSSTLNITNMVLFNKDLQITKYSSETEILEEFFHIRLELYQQRKDYQL